MTFKALGFLAIIAWSTNVFASEKADEFRAQLRPGRPAEAARTLTLARLRNQDARALSKTNEASFYVKNGSAVVDFISRRGAIQLPSSETEVIAYVGVELKYLARQNYFLMPQSRVVGTFRAQEILIRGKPVGDKLGLRLVSAEDLEILRNTIAETLRDHQQQINSTKLLLPDETPFPQFDIYLLDANYETISKVRADQQTRNAILEPVFKLFNQNRFSLGGAVEACQNLLKSFTERPSYF